MFINSISAAVTSKPTFGAVSISNGRRFASQKETMALMEKLRIEMQALQIQTDTDPIRRKAATEIDRLKQLCAELISAVKVSVSEKGLFESKKSYEARCRAAREEEKQKKADIQTEYDNKIQQVINFRDAQMEAVTQSNLKKAERADEISAAYKSLSIDIQRYKNNEEYYTVRAAHLKNTGFDRLAGYKDEKNILYKYFINEVKKERDGKEANVPGSILFFGPTGMGKTKFCKALAEEAECNEITLHRDPFENDTKTLERFYKKAGEAKKHFQQTGNRSIIFIDEIASMTTSNSSILKELEEFLITCSEKYHCTVFGTTNYPDKIALPLKNSDDLFPIRVLLDFPTHEDKKDIIKYYINDRVDKNKNYEQLTQIIENKEKNSNKLYSINRIKDICLEYITSEKEFSQIVEECPPKLPPSQIQKYSDIKSEFLGNNRIAQLIKYNSSYLDKFLNSTSDINYQDIKGNTILHNYAEIGDLDSVYKILESNIDSQIVNNEGLTAFDILLRNHKNNTNNVGFTKVIGMNNLKQILNNSFIEPLLNKDLYTKYGLSVSNGLLLYGPAGCGKTFIAEALAEESGRNLYKISPSDIASKYYDYATQKIKEIFDTARKNPPAMIFIDEMESIAPNRSNFTGSSNGAINQDVKQRVGELLQQMNNLSKENIFVVGATNHPDMVDEAVKRPGRLDRRILVPPPDFNARIGLFIKELAKRPIDLNLDLVKLANLTENYTAKEISIVVDEAAYRALKERRNICIDDLITGIKSISPSITNEKILLYKNLET